MSDYRPIDCALHSDYERLAMAQVKVQVRWRDHEGRSYKTTGTVSDVVTRRGEEFLLVRAEADLLEIRLDRIESVETI